MKKTSKALRLLRKQHEILGSDCPSHIFCPQLAEFHPPPAENAFFEDEEEQTYDQFVDMGLREPNLEGTGRFLLTPTRNRIGILFFNEKKGKRGLPISHQKKRLQQYISSFVGVTTDLIQYDADRLNLNEGTLHIGDYIYELNLFPQQKKGRKRKTKAQREDLAIEVFSLFDALESLVEEPYLSMIAFFECSLCEQLEEGDDDEGLGYQIVYGRACGNRIACVSLKDCETFKDLLCVTLHEMLHTIGFDHCNSWKCLMNATGSESWIFLSPVNLRKLIQFHHKEDDERFLIHRYQDLLSLLESWEDSSFVNEITWLTNKIQALQDIVAKNS